MTLFLIPGTVAEIVMTETFKRPVPIKFCQESNTLSSQPGDPFEIILDDTITYKNKTIPQGSHLVGTLIESRASKRFGRPGRFKVLFNTLEMSEPRQSIPLNYEGLKQKSYTSVFLEDKRHTYESLFSRQALIGLAANAVSVPFGLMFDNGLPLTLAFEGLIDGSVGASQELMIKSPNDKRSKLHRGAYGFFRGTTPFPITYTMLKKYPNLDYNQETEILLQFPKPMWQYIFRHV
ncbi:MAG: hypothetical protein AAGI66_08410 [Cyanobacteria bacterium P01_H01_bin.74]